MTPIRKAISVALLVPVAMGAAPVAWGAEQLGPGDVLTDAKLYFIAPARWDVTDWAYFGGTLLAIGAAHEYDGSVRTHFTHISPADLNGKDAHSVRDAIPAAAAVAGTWAFAALTANSSGRVEAYTMLEAAGFSAITATGLKFAAGRARPNETTRVNDWRVGGSSFPSLHASAAFAIGTVLAESGGDDFRWIRRFLGYGLAGATAYVRVHDGVHWLSDTVAGAAIGVATAHFTMNRRDERIRKWNVSVEPATGGGVALSFNMTLD